MTIENYFPEAVEPEIVQENEGVPDEKQPLLPVKKGGAVEVKPKGHASFAGGVFNLSTTIVGAGIMALPATMKVLGLIPGIIMVILIALLTDFSIQMLMKYSRAGEKDSYFLVMKDAYRKIGRRAVQTSVVVNNAGVMVVYMIIIGDVLSGTTADGVHHLGLLEGWFGAHWWNSRALVLLIITLFVFVPLARHKRVDSLKVTSAISVALAVVFVVITAGIAIYKLIDGTIEKPRLFPEITDLSSIWNLFTAVPVIVTAYICHYNVHSIGNELEDPNQIEKVVRVSLGLCSIVYICTSIFAYLLFGDSTLGDVLANFDSDLGIPYSSFFNDVVRVSYAVHVVLVFPVVFYALRINFDGLLFPKAKTFKEDKLRFVCVSASLLVVIYFTAIFVPSIWDAFQITGATAAVLIGFIFPAAITLRDVHNIAKLREKILSVIMIVLAVASSVVAIYSDIYSMFNKSKEA